MNNTKTEIKNTLEGIDSRKTEAHEWISELEDKIVEIITAEQNKEKSTKRTEDQFRDIWDIKRTNIWITGVPEEEEKKKGTEKISEEIIVENFPNMGKEISGVLKSPTMIVLLSISRFMAVSICLMYWVAPMLGA